MTRVLVVDDDATIRGLVAEVLDDEGYQVQTAGNGQAALDIIQGPPPPPDAIVTDLMMPVLDGWAFVEQCHLSEGCADIPIVVMSAASSLPQSAARLRAHGVRAVLAKPFDFDALVALVQRFAPAA